MLTLQEAVQILNSMNHNDVSDYEISPYDKYSNVVTGGISSYRYTEFETIAIAEKYLVK